MQSLRTQLVIVVGACLALVLAYLILDLQPRPSAPPPNPIPAENQQPGTDEWRLGRSGFQVSDDLVNQIKGYASATSVYPGGSLGLHVSVNPPQPYTIDVYRVGWYAGKGGRLMARVGPIEGTTQPRCRPDDTTGIIDCGWPTTSSLSIPTTWVTGVYVAVLTNAANYQNYIIFVVKDSARSPKLLYKQPVNTYQAYNNYPNDHIIGKSLYEHNSFGLNTVAGTPRAVKASFDRPYADRGAGDFFNWEVQLVHWLERNEYDVGYVTDVDFHNARTDQMYGLRGLLSVGHDEYWSDRMYDSAEALRDHGVNLAFFGADPVYWQVRYEFSVAGEPDRVLVCYRSSALDPIGEPSLETVLWRESPLNRPEQALVGVQFSAQLASNGDYVVAENSSWVYANSGLQAGDTVAGIVGFEVDSALPDYPAPDARPGSYELLSSSPVVNERNEPVTAHSSIYQARSGAWVFATGTMSWSWALDGDRFDPRVDRATANVINTFITGALPSAVTVAQPDAPYPRMILQSQPLTYWRLEQTTPRGFADVTRHGLDATFNRIVSVTSPPRGYPPAIAPNLPALGDFTISGWTYLDNPEWNADQNYNNTLYATVGRVRMIIRPGAPSSTSTLGLFAVWLNGTPYDIQPPTRGTSNINVWVHWAMVRQGTTLRVYRDGVLVGQRTDLPADALADVSGALFADRDGVYPLSGSLDDVALFPRALDGASIAELYSAAPVERLLASTP